MSATRQGVAIKMRTEGQCRTCGTGSNLTRHHLVPESWFRRNPSVAGRHDPRNIVPLCEYCHRVVDRYHSDDLNRRWLFKRCALRATLTQAEIAFMIGVRGKEWVQHWYPVSVPKHDSVRIAS